MCANYRLPSVVKKFTVEKARNRQNCRIIGIIASDLTIANESGRLAARVVDHFIQIVLTTSKINKNLPVVLFRHT